MLNFITSLLVGFYVLSLLVDPAGITFSLDIQQHALLAPSNAGLLQLGATGAWLVFEQGLPLTVFTGLLLHADLLHLFFNVASFRYVSAELRRFIGEEDLGLIFGFSAALASLASASLYQFWGFNHPLLLDLGLGGAYLGIGASGGVLGVVGALLGRGQTSGSLAARQTGEGFAMAGIVAGFLLGADNCAHLAGFAAGYLLSFVVAVLPLWLKRIALVLLLGIICYAVCLSYFHFTA